MDMADCRPLLPPSALSSRVCGQMPQDLWPDNNIPGLPTHLRCDDQPLTQGYGATRELAAV
eukprot:2375582-Rhodomonas_salina.4